MSIHIITNVTKRKYKHLLEVARALLFQSKLPIKYWGECILPTTYRINRLPNSTLPEKAPFETLFNKQSIYYHLMSFRCMCFLPSKLKGQIQPKIHISELYYIAL